MLFLGHRMHPLSSPPPPLQVLNLNLVTAQEMLDMRQKYQSEQQSKAKIQSQVRKKAAQTKYSCKYKPVKPAILYAGPAILIDSQT